VDGLKNSFNACLKVLQDWKCVCTVILYFTNHWPGIVYRNYLSIVYPYSDVHRSLQREGLHKKNFCIHNTLFFHFIHFYLISMRKSKINTKWGFEHPNSLPFHVYTTISVHYYTHSI